MKFSDQFAQQYAKYVRGEMNQQEFEQFLHDVNDAHFGDQLDDLLLKTLLQSAGEMEDSEQLNQLSSKVESQLQDYLEKQQIQHAGHQSIVNSILFPWKRLGVAACLLVGILSIVLWRVQPELFSTAVENQATTAELISPAGNRATIRLPDGRVIALDGDREGIVIDGDQVAYQDESAPILNLIDSLPEYLTVQTPRGGTYKVQLPDGTMVWLNTETTLKYPTRFSANERVVHLEGEAYFDVTRRSHQNGFLPFQVVSSSQIVEVLGTEFNISAYPDDEDIRTTLVNGKVTVHSPEHERSLELYPGEQGRIEKNGFYKTKVNVSHSIDWMRGQFVFDNETAGSALRQIARWYDVNLNYKVGGKALNERFSGSISRYDELQTVLDIVREAGGLDFDVQGREVMVIQK